MSDDKMWEFYEELSELVYVADMDSHELVYLNRKTRELYGINSMDEVRGKSAMRYFPEMQNLVFYAITQN